METTELKPPTATRPEVATSPVKVDVSHLMKETSMTNDVLMLFPNHKDSLTKNQENFEPVLTQVLNELQNGTRTFDDVRNFLLQERSLQMESGRMDSLSGELKRDELLTNLQWTIDKVVAQNPPSETIDIYFFDLVNFKNVNDALGQDGGNRVLQEAANKFRGLFPYGTPMLGGRVGDEFIYYRIRSLDENTEFPFEKTGDDEPPEKLTSVPTREGSIDVYFHMGKAVFDRGVDTVRTEKDERGTDRVVTPAMSLLQRADKAASDDKMATKIKHPELYLERHS